MNLKNIFLLVSISLINVSVFAQKYGTSTQAEVSKEWNGTLFSSNKTFAENIKEVPSFSIYSKALKNESLQKALAAEEMVTIFAVPDEAFLKLNKATRDSISNNSAFLSSIIKLYTIPGRVDSHSLKVAIAKNGGTAYFATLNNEKLGAKEVNGNIVLFDSKNNTATITDFDFYHKNGFFHIVDGVIFPAKE